jgi:hypothetical protein
VILRSTDVQAALRHRQRRLLQGGFLLNPFRFGVSPPPPDPHIASVKLLLLCNGTNGSTTFVDSSPSAHTLTANGNVVYTTSVQKFGLASAAFDGGGDYLSTPHSSDFSIQAGDFTLEAWVFRQNTGNTHYLLSKRPGAASNGWEWRISSSDNVQFFHTGGSILTSSGTVPSGQWVFLQTTRSGSTVSHFIHGTASGTNGSFTNGTENTDATLKVGVANDLGSGLHGWIGGMRVTKGVARANAVPTTQFADY